MSAVPAGTEFEAWAQSLREEYAVFLRQTWTAMQAARKGHWIEDTEEQVRTAGEVFRRQALEKLLQAQVAEGQKSFSPSAGRGLGEQGSAPGDAPDGGGAGQITNMLKVRVRARSNWPPWLSGGACGSRPPAGDGKGVQARERVR